MSIYSTCWEHVPNWVLIRESGMYPSLYGDDNSLKLQWKTSNLKLISQLKLMSVLPGACMMMSADIIWTLC